MPRNKFRQGADLSIENYEISIKRNNLCLVKKTQINWKYTASSEIERISIAEMSLPQRTIEKI